MQPRDLLPDHATDAPRRARRGTAWWFPPAYAPDPAVVARGGAQVRLGAGVMLASTIVKAGAAVVGAPSTVLMPVLTAVSALVWQGIVTAGLLVGSRLARGITIMAGVFSVFSSVVSLSLAAAETRVADASVHDASTIVIGVSLLTFATGSSLVTLFPAARTWLHVQEAARRVKRRAKSLADWRAAG